MFAEIGGGMVGIFEIDLFFPAAHRDGLAVMTPARAASDGIRNGGDGLSGGLVMAAGGGQIHAPAVVHGLQEFGDLDVAGDFGGGGHNHSIVGFPEYE